MYIIKTNSQIAIIKRHEEHIRMDLSIPAEWAIFIHRFKQAKNEKEKNDLLTGNTVDQILDYVFKILRNERDEQLKITVLIFLEDNAESFFSDKQR